MIKTAIWGSLSTILQNILLTIFFVVLARYYNPEHFSKYLIGNSFYQLFAALSTLGLGQWFARSSIEQNLNEQFVARYFKIQLYLGVFFYFVSILCIHLLYNDETVLLLSYILGFNIIIDNLIDGFKNLNIARLDQRVNFGILLFDAAFRCLLSVLLLMVGFSIISLSIIQVIFRLVTLIMFLAKDRFPFLFIKRMFGVKVTYFDLKGFVYRNIYFAIIGSISIVYWRSSNIIISKLLPPIDLAIFEIAFKVFVLFQIFPLILSSVLFPKLVQFNLEGRRDEFLMLYRTAYYLYFLFGLVSYLLIYLSSDYLVPLIFGHQYANAAFYVKQMLLVLLVFPTAFFQANVLVAMKMERLDMIINLFSLFIYGLLVFIGMLLRPDLDIVNFSILLSWIVFHLIQDYVLIRNGITNIFKVLFFHIVSIGCILILISTSLDFYRYALLFLLLTTVIVYFLYNRKTISRDDNFLDILR